MRRGKNGGVQLVGDGDGVDITLKPNMEIWTVTDIWKMQTRRR